MPMFSFWCYGPVVIMETSNCCNFQKNKVLGLSYQSTWINIIITILGSISYISYCIIKYCVISDDNCHIYDGGPEENILLFKEMCTAPFILLFLGGFFIFLMQKTDKNNNYCCLCFISNCTPLTERVVLDTYNFEVTYLEDYKQKQEFKLCLNVNDTQSNKNIILTSLKLFDINE